MPKSKSPDELKVFRDMLYAKIDIERARKIAADILYDDEYLSNLKRRARGGILKAGIEQMLWSYVFGKPQENINVNVNSRKEELLALSDEELAVRAAKLSSSVVEHTTPGGDDEGIVH